MRVPAMLRAIYRDESEKAVIMKGAQMGISEYVLDLALWTADIAQTRMRPFRSNAVYVQPGGENVGDFVQSRVSPIIDGSDYLTDRLPEAGSKGPNKVGLRQIGKGYTFWRTAYVKGRGASNRSGLKSIPIDTVILDEYDEMPPDTLALASHRLDSSRELGNTPMTRIISTPTYPGTGIEPEYLAGDQRRYFLTCEECDTSQPLEWEKNVAEGEDGHRLRVCVRCRESIEDLIERAWLPENEHLGEWRPTNPDGEYPSYHISQMYRPHIDLDAIAEALVSSELGKRQEAHNQHLGVPFSPPGGQLSLEELQRATAAPFTFADIAGVQGCWMGVDIGARIHAWIEWASDRWSEDGEPQRYLVGAYELDEFTELDDLMRRFGVEMCVVDANPELRMAQAFQRRHPGHVYLAEYVMGRMPPAILGEAEEDPKRRWHVQVDRTAAMDAVAAAIRDGVTLMPEDAESRPGLYSHLQAPVRLLKLDSQGNPRAVFEEGAKADHYYHAGVYAALAIYIAKHTQPQRWATPQMSSIGSWDRPENY